MQNCFVIVFHLALALLWLLILLIMIYYNILVLNHVRDYIGQKSAKMSHNFNEKQKINKIKINGYHLSLYSFPRML